MAEINHLALALNQFQAELVTVGKEANNPFYKSKYAELGAILRKSQPIATKHGLSVVQLPSNLNGEPALTTILIHTSGQSIEATVPLMLAKRDPQSVGSAVTYMRRYAYASVLQIVIDEDDDGNNSSAPPKRSTGSAMPVIGDATPEQKQKIANLLELQGVNRTDMKSWLSEKYGLNHDMSTKDAVMIIDDLSN